MNRKWWLKQPHLPQVCTAEECEHPEKHFYWCRYSWDFAAWSKPRQKQQERLWPRWWHYGQTASHLNNTITTSVVWEHGANYITAHLFREAILPTMVQLCITLRCYIPWTSSHNWLIHYKWSNNVISYSGNGMWCWISDQLMEFNICSVSWCSIWPSFSLDKIAPIN